MHTSSTMCVVHTGIHMQCHTYIRVYTSIHTLYTPVMSVDMSDSTTHDVVECLCVIFILLLHACVVLYVMGNLVLLQGFCNNISLYVVTCNSKQIYDKINM